MHGRPSRLNFIRWAEEDAFCTVAEVDEICVYRSPAMSNRPSRVPRNTSERPEESALRSELDRLARFIDSLESQCDRARQRADRVKPGTPTAAKSLRRVEQLWLELEAARRLHEAVVAAVLVATAHVAAIEAEASASIKSAFQQFAMVRAAIRRASIPVVRSTEARSAVELGGMVAAAKDAVLLVVVDRERLARKLAEVQVTEVELRQEAGMVEDPVRKAELLARATMCGAHVKRLRRQLLMTAAAAQRGTDGLRKLFNRLPESVRILAKRMPRDRN